jgi:hypothetical protein
MIILANGEVGWQAAGIQRYWISPLLRHNPCSGPDRGAGHETPRFHHFTRRRNGWMAIRLARAAEGDAGDRLPGRRGMEATKCLKPSGSGSRIGDRASVQAATRVNAEHPPFGGGTHSPLPLPDRNLLVLADEASFANCSLGLRHTWLFDVREPTNPVSFATMPVPSEADYCAKGGNFGPHNLWEKPAGRLPELPLHLRDLSQCRRPGL